MKKLILLVSSVVALGLAIAVAPAGAAPKNASQLTLDCSDAGEVDVHVVLGSSGAAVFDATGEGGRAYLIQTLEVRAYPGELVDEPNEEPAFSFNKEYGNRGGFSESLDCSGSFIEPNTPEGPATIFFDVTLVAK